MIVWRVCVFIIGLGVKAGIFDKNNLLVNNAKHNTLNRSYLFFVELTN